jgi:glycosyltransferase involved in cell wall biosynthesis
MRPLNVAVVTTRLFGSPANGGELCTARLLAALLRAGHRVRVIGRGDPAATMGAAAQALQVHAVGPLVLPFDDLPAGERARGLLGALWRRRAWTVHRLQQPDVPARVQALLRSWQDWPVDALVVDHLHPLSWIAGPRAGLPAPVVVMHNLESAGHAEQGQRAALRGHWLAAAAHRREHRLLLGLERRVLSEAAAVACLCEADASSWREQARRAVSAPAVEVLSGHPAAARGVRTQSRPDNTSEQQGRPRGVRRIGLVGTWTWGPNRDGLDWLMREVVPKLDGNCQVLLAGPGSQQIPLPAGVKALGWVDDLAGFYASLDVVALPSHSGSGVHEKALEALALAPLVVATPHALRGLGGQLPPHMLVAADGEHFARLCSRARIDPRERGHAADLVLAWCHERRQAYEQSLARCLQAVTQRTASGGMKAPPAEAMA